jgi:hypothetical protein
MSRKLSSTLPVHDRLFLRQKMGKEQLKLKYPKVTKDYLFTPSLGGRSVELVKHRDRDPQTERKEIGKEGLRRVTNANKTTSIYSGLCCKQLEKKNKSSKDDDLVIFEDRRYFNFSKLKKEN